MSRTIRIRGDSATFPGEACVHCLSPATETVQLVKVKRSAVRRVSVPYCASCLALRKARSPAQVQSERIATLVGFLAAWAAGVWVYLSVLSWEAFAVRNGPVWAGLVGLLVVDVVFAVLHMVGTTWSLRYRSPETRAALNAVRIRSFDWETTTLEFADDVYADRFALANAAIVQADTEA
ncbi:MAG: hypothetical protein JXA09_04730 [Anaerolineae bacterium]|nr:hypothetical protein [Anaerolineae bacterium]